MADFDDARFPIGISMLAIGGPKFKTSVATMASGHEGRVQWWENDRGEWTVSFDARTPAHWEPLVAFFRVISKGQANTFRFRDHTDYVCANGAGFFAAIEGETDVQMVKRYTYGAYTYDRIIRKPITGEITTDATGLNYATGVATTGTTWYGNFDCKCRLGVDAMRCQVIDRNNTSGLIVGWEGIEIVEVLDLA